MRRWIRLHTQPGRSSQKNRPSRNPARPAPRSSAKLRFSRAIRAGSSALICTGPLPATRTASKTSRLIVRYSRKGST